MHFAEAVAAFEIQLKANQRSRHTVRSYLRDLRMLRGWLERKGKSLDVGMLTPTTLCEFAASRAATHQEDGSPRKPGSIDKIKMSVRAFFGFLNDAGLIPTNPARILKYRRGRERVLEVLTADECQRLLRAATGAHGARDAMILDLLLRTGIRLESLVGLDVEDVRLAEKRLMVRHQKGGRAGRSRSRRSGRRPRPRRGSATRGSPPRARRSRRSTRARSWKCGCSKRASSSKARRTRRSRRWPRRSAGRRQSTGSCSSG